MRPRSSKVWQDIYSDATEKPYGYLDIDLSQTCPDKLRYKTDLFNPVVKVFVIMSNTSFKTMYLVNKSLIEENQNFKLSIRNKDICSDGMNVIVKPIKQRTSKKINNNQENIPFDNNEDKNGSHDENNDNNHENLEQKSQHNINQKNDKSFFKVENNLAPEYHSSDNINEIAPTHQDLQDFNKSTHSGRFKRKNTDSFVQKDKTTKRVKMDGYNSPLAGNFIKSNKKHVRKYRLNKYQKRLKKRNFHDFSMTLPKSHNQDTEFITQKIKKDEHKKVNIDSDDKDSNEIKENTLLLTHDQNKTPIGQRIENNKRKRIEDESDDQWMSGLKSRLNERRVQFKRKHDTIGYRVLPDDESKSIIKPSDFKFMDPVTSSELLGKWKSLKELKKKQTSTKRHKPQRSFSIWKETNN